MTTNQRYIYIGESTNYVFATYWEAVSSASGTVTIPAGSTVKLDAFQDLEDAVVSTITTGLPDFNAADDGSGNRVVATFDSSGNYTLSPEPASYPVALMFRVIIPENNIDWNSDNIVLEDIHRVGGSGSGDVVGPASSVNNRVVFFNGETGKLIKDSGLTLSGTNTGDQTITLTGDVTGSGTGSFAATIATGLSATKIADGSVNNTKFQYLNDVTSNIQSQIDGKQSTGSYITGLTGDISATGPGSVSATIASNAITTSKIADANITEAKLLIADNTTANVSTSTHGFVPKAPNNASMFFRGDATWKAPCLFNQNSSGNVVANAADTYLTGSNLTIGSVQKAGTVIKWILSMTKSGAGVAAPVFNVRFGTNGTTADTARLTWTGAAQTAATDTGWAEITVVIRSVSATGEVAGNMNFTHHNATTGLANVSRPQNFSSVSSTFDNTSTSLITGISVNPGASGVWTFQVVSVEAYNFI